MGKPYLWVAVVTAVVLLVMSALLLNHNTAAEPTAKHALPSDGPIVYVYRSGSHYYAIDLLSNKVICVDSPTACIQEAIDYAQSYAQVVAGNAADYKTQPGGEVLIGPGVYVVNETIQLPSGFALVGSGMRNTVITQGGPFPIMEWRDPTRTNQDFVIRDLTFYGAYATSKPMIDLSQVETGSHGLIEDVYINCNPAGNVCLDISGDDDIALIGVITSLNTDWDNPSVRAFVPGGNINIIASKLFGGGVFMGENINFLGDVFGPYQQVNLFTVPNHPAIYNFEGCYFNNATRIYVWLGQSTVPVMFIDMEGAVMYTANPVFVNPSKAPITIYLTLSNTYMYSSQPASMFDNGIHGFITYGGAVDLVNVSTNTTG